jgi:homoserine kinase
MPDSVTVRVPATSANLGPGFDCLGMALDLWATITLSAGQTGGEGEPMAHMALVAARAIYERAGKKAPALAARYEGSIPIARGLGASAVARAGGAVAANALGGEPLDREELLAVVSDLEGHADNAAPALFGGFQVSVVQGGRVLHTSVPLPRGLYAVLFVPELRMPTKESRKLLPESLARADVVHNTGRAALMVAAMARGRFDLLDAATDDRLHQRPRSRLFPGMYDIFAAAKEAGAHCAYLSGGGSTICALATAGQQRIAEAMLGAAAVHDTRGETIITTPTMEGAEVVEAA